MTLEQWEEERDRELDERLAALFRSARPAAPSAGFARRTMSAVRQAPLPAGRRPLRAPYAVLLGWAALVAVAAALTAGVLFRQPALLQILAFVIADGVRAGVWLLEAVRTGAGVLDLFVKTGTVVAMAASTKEAGAGLALLAGVAAFSLFMLDKLLLSKKESSSW